MASVAPHDTELGGLLSLTLLHRLVRGKTGSLGSRKTMVGDPVAGMKTNRKSAGEFKDAGSLGLADRLGRKIA